MWRHARGLRGRSERRAASADRLRPGIEGLGGGGKPKSRCHAMGVAYEDIRAGSGNPTAERRDG